MHPDTDARCPVSPLKPMVAVFHPTTVSCSGAQTLESAMVRSAFNIGASS